MIPYSTQSIDQTDIDAVVNALQSSHLTQGKEVKFFEEEICAYLGVSYAITFNSATSALLAAYSVAEIGDRDEVITSPISFVATSNMFVDRGAKPLWCDVRLDGNIDETRIEALISPATKAIVPIDFAGKPVAIEKIKAIARKHKLLVIEDAAHAFGSSINGKKVGTQADMSIFSFHAIKPFTTGEGGCVVTNNKEFAQKLRLFRSHGMVKKKLYNSDMQSMGHNFRLTEFAAALGRSQLKRLDTFITHRDEIARYYEQRFAHHKLFFTIKPTYGLSSSHHLYPILLNPSLHCLKEEIFESLQAKSLGVQVHYKPIYQNSFYKERFGQVHLDVAEDFYRSELSIPCHQGMDLDDAAYVADTLLEVLSAIK